DDGAGTTTLEGGNSGEKSPRPRPGFELSVMPRLRKLNLGGNRILSFSEII
ncbi:unnamed protein product, partial [Amoebophrya sp. A25]